MRLLKRETVCPLAVMRPLFLDWQHLLRRVQAVALPKAPCKKEGLLDNGNDASACGAAPGQRAAG
jgi:hypothetical protein